MFRKYIELIKPINYPEDSQDNTFMYSIDDRAYCSIMRLFEAFWFYHKKELYLVGGIARDLLLARQPKDYDLTTNASLNEIRDVCKELNLKTFDSGVKHGTLTIIDDFYKLSYELTVYRIDGKYSDGRRPDEVTFTPSLEEDLKRRDFTINSFAYNFLTKELLALDESYFRDLETKIIRAVGNPLDRFDEDPLRILRGLRFASKLGFSIAMPTLMAMYEKKEKLALISMERIREELIGILCGEYASEVLLNPYAQLILAEVLPEIVPMFDFNQRNKYHKHDVWTHTVMVVSAIKDRTPVNCMSALLHDIGKPSCFQPYLNEKGEINYHFIDHPLKSVEISSEVLERLKFSNDEIYEILWLVENHDYQYSDNKRTAKHLLMTIKDVKYREDLIDGFINIARADQYDHIWLGKKPYDLENFKRLIDEVIENEVYDLKQLTVNGNDMIKLGYVGKEIGDILKELLEKVVNEELENKYEILLEYARSKKE